MTFGVLHESWDELMNQKVRARQIDIEAIQSGESSAKSLHTKNAFLHHVNEWAIIHKPENHDAYWSGEYDVIGGELSDEK